MKNKKNIPVMIVIMAVAIVSVFNFQKVVNLSNEIGGNSGLTSIFTLTEASANIIPPDSNNCKGDPCAELNGLKYSTFGSGTEFSCCGVAAQNTGRLIK